MKKVNLQNPRSYFEAGDNLLEQINLNNVQLRDYNNFINNTIHRLLSTPIITDKFTLQFKNWYIDDSKSYTEEVCKANGYSREVSLRATAVLKLTNGVKRGDEIIYEPNSIMEFPIEITRVPKLTDKGTFLIKGVDRIMVSHLEKANTITKEINRKDKNKFMSFSKKNGAAFNIAMNKGKPMMSASIGPTKMRTSRSRIEMSGKHPTTVIDVLAHLNLETEEEIESVIGVNPYLTGIEPDTINTINTAKAMMGIQLTLEERALLNQKLSFKTRLSNKILAQDVKIPNLNLRKGHKVTFEEAEQLQQYGLTSIAIQIPGGVINVMNNGFVQPDKHIDEELIPSIMKRWSTSNDINKQEDLVEDGYFDFSLPEYEELEKTLGHLTQEELKEQLKLYEHILVGTNITKGDIMAIINMYSLFLLDVEKEDDIDSLTNKSLVNITSVFESLLEERLYGMKSSSKSSIISTLERDMNYLTVAGESNGNQLDLTSLSCRDANTITTNLVIEPWSKLFQVESNVNPLDEINHKRRISLTKIEQRGGIDSSNSDAGPRSVNPSHLGRICPVETPEGPNVGLVLHLAALAHIDENGIIEAPFFKIDKNTQTINYSEAVYMNYDEEQLYTRAIVPRIAEEDFAKLTLLKQGSAIQVIDLEPIYNGAELVNKDLLEKQSEVYLEQNKEADSYRLEYGRKDWFIDEIIDCIQGNGNMVKVGWDEIDYVTCSGEHVLSVVTGNIPFSNYDDGARLMMGASMSKQTEAILGAQRPLVGTKLTSKIGSETNRVIVAPFDCLVERADCRDILIRSLEDDTEEFIQLKDSIVTSEFSVISNRLNVKAGDIVMKGEVLADIESTENGHVRIGTNLTVAYLPFFGYNYEDAIVISEKLVKEDTLTSFRATKYEFRFNPAIDQHPSKATGYSDFITNVADEKGIAKVGTRVKKGDILALKATQSNKKGSISVKTLTHTTPHEGIVTKVDEILEGNSGAVRYEIVVTSKAQIQIGDKLAGRHGNKGVTSKILPEYKMPRLADGTIIDIILTPLGVPSRMNIGQLNEAQLGLVLKDAGFRVNYDARSKIDMPLLKKLTNEWTGDPDGKMQLYDGTTGRPLLQKTTVGVTSINKLRHLSGYSISGRGVGNSPNEYTSEGHPTRGKKRGGGQRWGEMEMWALEAHGAGKVVKEIATYKSDDVSNRENFSRCLSENKELDYSGNLPMSYKITMLELMSRGVDVLHIGENNKEIDIFTDAVTSIKRNQKQVNRSNDKYMKYINNNKIVEQEKDSEIDDLIFSLREELNYDTLKPTTSLDSILNNEFDDNTNNSSESVLDQIGDNYDNLLNSNLFIDGESIESDEDLILIDYDDLISDGENIDLFGDETFIESDVDILDLDESILQRAVEDFTNSDVESIYNEDDENCDDGENW